MDKEACDFQEKSVGLAEASTWLEIKRVFGSLLEIRDYVHKIMMSDSWSRICRKYGRLPSRPVAVAENNTNSVWHSTAILMFASLKSNTFSDTIDAIYVRQRWFICHQMAHMATGHLVYTHLGKVAVHGPEFADAYLNLVIEMLGVAEGARLLAAFERYGVKHEVTSFDAPTSAQMEAYYRENDDSWRLKRLKNISKAIIVGDEPLTIFSHSEVMS